ncbi:ubiquitin carboxyl-terminal hydrolase 25-like isoform X2 [Macadamia integrifolia]|uniref:ubiquitin carboxyl-terminal hydrolase 25-like isoform X2 n=1 Tax=Macadamia integrifolia TaxID=60698 RepID=UPI001C52B09A|nr:ubiquitin carboxyl-terminal hydrolase 25-like isoform X2 [Macadamia integrifolia]
MALQMTWQLNLLHRRKNGPPVGLRNLGNSCYLNSVLQCLTYTPPLANFCLKSQHSSLCDSTSEADRKRDCPFCILEKRIVRSLSVDLPLDAPKKIQNCLRIFSEHFRFGRQEDAHEFLRYVIDACHNTCLRLKKLQQQCRKGNESCNGASAGGSGSGGDTIVKEIFGGALQSQVKCLSCGAESNKTDDIMDISLDLFQSNSLKEAMQRFFQSEILDGSNKYKCEKCKKLVPARKQMSILKAPNVLVIQLKRFEGIHGGKIDRPIAFEEVLVLSSYMCKATQDPCPEYNLFGTIVHSGYSPESGHYYAYIKDAIGRWYCCNDSQVSLSTLQEVLSEKVYILFFSRINQRPKPTKSAFASNGLKSPNCNGNDAMGRPKAVLPLKTVPAKPIRTNSPENGLSTMSKTGMVPLGPRIDWRNPNVKSIYANGNGNGYTDVNKSSSVEKRVKPKDSLPVDITKNEVPSTVDRNGANGNRCRGNEGKEVLSLPHQNGEIQSNGDSSVKMEVCKNNGAIGEMPNCDHAVSKDKDHHLPELSGSKRKYVDETCMLLAHDASSLAKLEKFKEVLAKDASSSLRSHGWHDKVYHFMLERKRQCAREAGNSSISNTEIKKMLIGDAKANFISQIPEPLKEHLVECLKSFSKEKK